jgi:hypothetical protein
MITEIKSCYQLGVCQGRTPPCSSQCARVQAFEQWADEGMTATPIEQIAYWATVAIACVCTVAIIAGAAGYAWARLG